MSRPWSGGARPRFAEADALELAGMRIPGPVELVVDHREPDELARLLAEHPQAEVTRAALAIGDVAINRQEGSGGGRFAVLVERKDCSRTPTDFEASITQTDKRLFRQVEALAQSEAIGVLLLEGDVFGNSRGMLLEQISGFLSFAAVIQTVSVIPTLSLHHSAHVLLKLAAHQRFGLGYNLALRGRKPKRTLDAARFVLEGLPGINAGLARALLERFGSVRAVANASEEELRAVAGIGEGRAKAMLACLRGEG